MVAWIVRQALFAQRITLKKERLSTKIGRCAGSFAYGQIFPKSCRYALFNVVGTKRMQKSCGLMLMGAFLLCLPVSAQKGAAALIESVGVDQKLGVDLPLDLEFVNREGKTVKLGQIIDGSKVTILVPVYYSCPGLCTSILGSVTNIIDGMSLDLGDDYQIVNVSFDPTNTPELAREKATTYRTVLGEKHREAAKSAWYFLTGSQENITKLMDLIGFRYKKVGEEYSHAAALVAVTRQGKVARYLTGIGITPEDARFALVETSQGSLGSPIDLVLSYCYRYDPTAGKYVPLAWRIMRIGCLIVLFLMCVGGGILWKTEFVRKRRLEHNV